MESNCSHAESSSTNGREAEFGEQQEHLVPLANVGRIMRKILPPNAKVSKEAKQTMQECVSEFISFVTGEASDKCKEDKRKTINGEDIIWAFNALGFQNYVHPLGTLLHNFKATMGVKLSLKEDALPDDSPIDNQVTTAYWDTQFSLQPENQVQSQQPSNVSYSTPFTGPGAGSLNFV